MKKMLYVCLFFSFSSMAQVSDEKISGEKKASLSRFRGPASVVEIEHLAQKAEKNIQPPKLKMEKKSTVNPTTQLPERVKQLTPGGTNE
jgi:hypothetical protein